MILKIFYVVQKRETVIQYKAGPFATSLAAEDYIRENINAQFVHMYTVAKYELDVEIDG